ncbi:MAG: hypothetical protein JWN85_4454 [Gammaproteobacteria bacterium]|nr:hypothetical protein [Gammaproteobacteria bacterium]
MQLQQLGYFGFRASAASTADSTAGGSSGANYSIARKLHLETDWAAASQQGQVGGTNTPAAGSNGGGLGARLVNRESATLRIQTAEGDQVTIRLREKTSASLSPAQASAAGGSSAGTGVTLVSSGQIQVEVSGDLNPAELKSIGDVLSQVDALATKFFSGDAQGAFATAASIGSDPAQIAGFSLQLSYSSRLFQPAASGVGDTATTPVTGPAMQPTQPATVTQLTQTAGTSASTGTPAPTASSAPAGSSTSPNQPASSPAGTAPTGASSTSTPTATSGSTSGSSSAASSSSTPTASPQQTIANFLQDVLSKLGATAHSSSISISLRWKLEVLARSLPAYAPAPTAATTQATSLAADTLSQLSA